MAINPNIALSYRAPEFVSPVQLANQMMAFKAAQRENQLAEMQMAEAQRKRAQAEQLNALYAGALDPKTGQLDYNRLRSGMAAGGFGTQIPGVTEDELKGREQRGKAGKAEADAFTSAMDASKSNLRLDMSPEEYLAWHENNHRDPIIGPYLARLGVTSDTTRPKIIEAINTGRLPDLIKESALGIDKMTEQHFFEQNQGPTTRLMRTSKRGGKAEVVPGSEAAITMSPAEQARIDLERRRVALAEAKPTEENKYVVRERAKAEAKRPQATAAYNTATNEIDRLIEDLTTLKNDSGVEGITGLVYGRTPGVTAQARRAEALFDKIMAKGQFRALQDLRNASPTGGALGQITDKENAALRASFGALDRKQATADFKANIDKVISDLQFSRSNIEGAFNDTYGESAGAPAAGSPAPAAGAGGQRATRSGTRYTIED